MGKVIPPLMKGQPVSSGVAFAGAQTLVATEFSDFNGWGTPSHYKCLWLIPNLDGTPNDLHPAICGRGMSGIYCARWRCNVFCVSCFGVEENSWGAAGRREPGGRPELPPQRSSVLL
jgi:hypothetical protein